MRITLCLPNSFLAGGTRVVLIYAKKLRERGHQVCVITQTPKQKPQTLAWALRRRLRALKTGSWRDILNTFRPVSAAAGGPAQDSPLAFLGSDHIVADRNSPDFATQVPDADVIVATWWETAFSIMTLPERKGRKFYFVQHHEVHDHLPSHLSAGSYYLPMPKITITGWLRDTMRDLYGDAHVPVIHNSVDTTQFHAPPRAPQATPTIGYMYSRSAYKGCDVAAQAIAVARQQIPNLKVVCFGKPAARSGHELPKDTIYIQTPTQDSLRDIYAMCDGWLLPSHSEGFGLPVLEAMACRTPVISTRTGIGPDIIEDGKNGYLVDIGDSATMGTRIIDMVSQSPQGWTAMSDAAYACATANTWDRATDQFETLLEAEVAKARTPQRTTQKEEQVP